MKVENSTVAELKLKKTVKIAGFIGGVCGGAKVLSDIKTQYCAMFDYYRALDKFEKQKDCIKELTGQFLNKSPRIAQKILKPFDNKILQLKQLSNSKNIPIASFIKDGIKTGCKAAGIIGIGYYILSTIKDISNKEV